MRAHCTFALLLAGCLVAPVASFTASPMSLSPPSRFVRATTLEKSKTAQSPFLRVKPLGGLNMIGGGADPALVERLLDAKSKTGKTFDQISKELGLTNTYTTQLFLGQAQLKPGRVEAFKKALPAISDSDIKAMQKPPMRGFDDEILKEPNVYRTYEAITHYGEAIKMLINEKCGDGIMSAIDFYLDVSTITGKAGEQRVVITFNGKFLPFIEQIRENNTAPIADDLK